jgi:(1->4)-alpha-D-glucan 1-alpha-D-glucosylmutase
MTPRATYRLQFNRDFGFKEAARIAPYLARLGVSHVYASPWLKARSGSYHGYDIVDHQSLNPELGSRQDFDAMAAAFRTYGLRQIADFVPNHMGVGGADNPLWLDVLEWGPESVYAGWFDIEWRSDRQYLQDKLLVPFLGDQYGVELYSGKLTLKFDQQDGSFAVWAYDSHKLPICPLHYGRILGDAFPELERLGDEFANLPEWRPQVGRRALELKATLAACARESEKVRNEIAAALERFAGLAGNEGSWALLNDLIRDQYWRAADFRVAADDINYRRFFNVNDLAGLRMELPDVFEHSHKLIFELIADGTLDGLRIDHVDGLLNPREYLKQLCTHPSIAGRNEPFYLVVEKILAHHETLRYGWPVDGTTGYEFTNLVLGLLIDPAGEDAFTRLYVDWTGERKSMRDVVRDCKLRIMRNEMASELDVLARDAARVAHQTPRTADFTHNVLRRAIREVIASFPIYRTYVDPDGPPTKEDRRDLNWAMKQAKTGEIDLDPSVFEFVQSLLSGDLLGEGRSGFSRHAVLRCAMKLQQFSGPVMAKGLEDTAFYRYNRFIALNEVGGDPEQFGVTIANFHKANSQRARHWPHSMLTTSTHDTKRGEDTRARLAVLSEVPQEWAGQVETWSRVLRARRNDIAGAAPPDRNDEYMLYQLMVGSWPAELTGCRENLDPVALQSYLERLKGAMTKSMREAKVHTTWRTPNRAYEDSVLSFIDGALDPVQSGAFLSAFLPFQERVARLGVQNSLVQVALKLTAPGVPDLYQGADLWDLSLVDPDNRRPVDFERRIRLFDELNRPAGELLSNWRSGAIKLFVTAKLLRFRANAPELFANGKYDSLSAAGPMADCVCAFERHDDLQSVIVLAARYPARREAAPEWLDTTIPVPASLQNKKLRDLMTGSEIRQTNFQIDAAEVFRDLPIAVITSDDGTNSHEESHT